MVSMVSSTTWYTEADSRQLCHEGQHDASEELESIVLAVLNDLPMTMLTTRNQMRKKDGERLGFDRLRLVRFMHFNKRDGIVRDSVLGTQTTHFSC
jgi:hypothetical protein